jgi:SAM-dependent methyltransferase
LSPAEAWTSGTSGDDKVLIDRLICAYQLVDKESQALGDSMWVMFFDEFHKEIHEAIVEGDRRRVEEILRDPASSDLFYGFDNLSRFLLSGRRLEDRYAPSMALDGLIRLGEAMGVRRLDNPETYACARQHRVRIDDAIDAVEKGVGFRLEIPNPFPREFGARSKRGVISYRVPQAVYQAWRISQILSNVTDPRVLEIGAGLGRTAFYCRQFGIRDYTIVDIPMSLLAQGYFLGRTLGAEHVLLFGERADDASSRIKVLPPKTFLGGSERYDLVVNVDSLTEIDEGLARSYWSEIQKRAGTFLSINHESNLFSVGELIQEGANVQARSRMPYWMRRGYVEEVVSFTPR